MKIFFLGDIVGKSGRLTVIRNLKDIVKKNKIDFVVVNGEVDLCCLPRSTLGRNGCDKLSLPRYIGRGVVKVAVVEVVDGAAGGAAGGCGDC